jgi:hypothetical protein
MAEYAHERGRPQQWTKAAAANASGQKDDPTQAASRRSIKTAPRHSPSWDERKRPGNDVSTQRASSVSVSFKDADSRTEELYLLGQEPRDMEGIFKSNAAVDAFANHLLAQPNRVYLLGFRKRDIHPAGHLTTGAQEFELAAIGCTGRRLHSLSEGDDVGVVFLASGGNRRAELFEL